MSTCFNRVEFPCLAVSLNTLLISICYIEANDIYHSEHHECLLRREGDRRRCAHCYVGIGFHLLQLRLACIIGFLFS